MTIKNLYPPNRPASIYNVINGRPELPISGTLTRASVGSFVGPNKRIATAIAGQPRFTYDMVTGEYLGLLMEEEATNHILDSEDCSSLKADNADNVNCDGDRTPLTDNIDTPFGKQDCARLTLKAGQVASYWTFETQSAISADHKAVFSCYFKTDDTAAVPLRYLWVYLYVGSSAKVHYLDLEGSRNQSTGSFAFVDDAGNGWKKVTCQQTKSAFTSTLTIKVAAASGLTGSSPVAPGDINGYICGAQLESSPVATSFIPTGGATAVTREKDEFSISTVNNFDDGFSLLLDTETTSDDTIYAIYADGSEIASLSNDGGTINWEINGTSAQTNGDYPQVGFVKGRVRTISSFTAAGDSTNPNYLYTTGLSFPTVAAPAPGADEIKFGVPQILKAIYVWNGQLNPVQAVSIIKGESNIVPNIPINANKYSFVYNTDPADNGSTSAELKGIVPINVSGGMTVDWGDGTPINTYNKGVTPSHDYPYPGQYRIQVSGNETWNPPGDITGTLTGGGFDEVTLGYGSGQITRVDQWAPQHRTTASSTGFNGTQMESLLLSQNECTQIPDYSYLLLTVLDFAFGSCKKIAVKGPDNASDWSWIPSNIPSVRSMNSAFAEVSVDVSTPAERGAFPQLNTSNDLTNIREVFFRTKITGWSAGGTPTNKPFTNTSGVTNFDGAFRGCQFTSLELDTSQGRNFNSCFSENSSIVTFPQLVTNKGTSFSATWSYCSALTGFTVWPDFRQSQTMGSCFYATAIATWPTLDFQESLNCSYTFANNQAVVTGPQLQNTELVGDFSSAFTDCSLLETVPKFKTDSCETIRSIFNNAKKVKDIDVFTDTSKIKNWSWAFFNIKGITSVPAFDYSAATNLENCFCNSQNITSFPAGADFSKVNSFRSAWSGCLSLASWPTGMFNNIKNQDGNADSLKDAFNACALSKNSIQDIFDSIVTSNATGGILGVQGGNNSPRFQGLSADAGTTLEWTQKAADAFKVLYTKKGDPVTGQASYPGATGRGWTITYNKYSDEIKETPKTFITYDNDVVVMFEAVSFEGGKERTEEFASQRDAIKRVLELNPSYFQSWDPEKDYPIGSEVNVNGRVYRSLENIPPKALLRERIETAEAAVRSGQSWEEIYEPPAEGLVVE